MFRVSDASIDLLILFPPLASACSLPLVFQEGSAMFVFDKLYFKEAHNCDNCDTIVRSMTQEKLNKQYGFEQTNLEMLGLKRGVCR